MTKAKIGPLPESVDPKSSLDVVVRLPQEVLIKIFSYLVPQDIEACRFGLSSTYYFVPLVQKVKNHDVVVFFAELCRGSGGSISMTPCSMGK